MQLLVDYWRECIYDILLVPFMLAQKDREGREGREGKEKRRARVHNAINVKGIDNNSLLPAAEGFVYELVRNEM